MLISRMKLNQMKSLSALRELDVLGAVYDIETGVVELI